METRVSFFIVAGFLVPGIVFSLILVPFALALTAKYGLPHWLSSLPSIGGDAAAAVVITFLGFGFLACCFSVGIFFSDLYFKLLELARRRRRGSERLEFEGWVGSGSLHELLAKDWRLQEAYVLSLTQGPDIYGYAARNRMLGATGLAVLIAGVVYLFAGWFVLAWLLLLLGCIFVTTGSVLVRRYREWITAYAALFLVTERTVRTTPRSTNEAGE